MSLSVDLPAELVTDLQQAARERGVSVSEIVKAACLYWFQGKLAAQLSPQPSVTGWHCGECGQWVPLNAVHLHLSPAVVANPCLYWSCPACGGACGPGWMHTCPCNGYIYEGNGYTYGGPG